MLDAAGTKKNLSSKGDNTVPKPSEVFQYFVRNKPGVIPNPDLYLDDHIVPQIKPAIQKWVKMKSKKNSWTVLIFKEGFRTAQL